MNKVLRQVVMAMWITVILSAPQPELQEQGEEAAEDEVTKSAPYQFAYTVKDEQKLLFINRSETGNEDGKVQGKYSALLADGRFQMVEYTADKTDGFVPIISYSQDENTFS